jgi:VWFA-related protein
MVACGVCSAIAATIAATVSLPAGSAMQQSFRVDTNAVVLSVSVLDRQRQPIIGLQENDFEVLEDGKPVRIVAFTPIEFQDASQQDTWTRQFTSDVESNDIEPRRFIVIVIDDATIDFDPGAVRLARDIANRTIDRLGPEDRAAIVYTYLGRNQSFTADRSRLRAAVDSFVPHPNPIGCALRSGGGCDVSTLANVATSLRDAPSSRKILIYIGGGRNLAAMTDKALSSVDDVFSRFPAVGAMLTALQQANVTVYAFDPHGLRTRQPGADVRGSAAARPVMSPPPNELLRSFADSTGGRAFTDMNVPTKGVDDVFEENRSYYLIGFVSQFANDGRFRKLRVRVKGDAAVRARTGYIASHVAADGTGRASGASPLRAAIGKGLPSRGLQLRATAGVFPIAKRREGDILLVVGVLPESRGHDSDSSLVGARRVVDLTAIAFDRSGRERAMVTQKIELGRRPSRTPALPYETALKVRLPPGDYEVRIGAESGGRVGTVFLDVDIPVFSPDLLSATGILLGNPLPLTASNPASDLLPIRPTTVRDFQQTDQIAAFLRLHQSRRGQPTTAVARILNEHDRIVFEEKAEFPSEVDWLVDLPLRRLTVGEYLLSMQVSRGVDHLRRTVRFRIR